MYRNSAVLCVALGIALATPIVSVAGSPAKFVMPAGSVTVGSVRLSGRDFLTTPQGRQLGEQVAGALRGHLSVLESNGHWAKVEAGKASGTLFTESDLSMVDPDGSGQGAFLLVTRLYRKGQSQQLVAQFAGTAKSTRDLLGNQSDGSDSSNLVAAVARQIGKVAADSSTAAFEEMVTECTASRRLTVDIVPARGNGARPRLQVSSGEKYRLRIHSQDAGETFLVESPVPGAYRTPYSQSDPHTAGPGEPVMLPPNTSFVAPTVDKPTWIESIVFLRRGTPAKQGLAVGTATGVGRLDVGGTQTGTGNLDVGGTETGIGKLEKAFGGTAIPAPQSAGHRIGFRTPPLVEESGNGGYRLLSCMPLATPAVDAGVLDLLSRYSVDPKGKWHAVRLRIQVLP